MKGWKRVLTVILKSRKLHKEIVFGNNYVIGREDLEISVSGNKYMSSLKDECTIKIKNLDYSNVVKIIEGEYYDVEVLVGYQNSSIQTIFKGGVLYISNSLDSVKDNTIIILCASELITRYGRSRINLTLNSGINMYSAIKYLTRVCQIPEQEANISSQLKRIILQNETHSQGSISNFLNQLSKQNENLVLNSDKMLGSVFSIYDVDKSNARIINLNSKTINLEGGYPQFTTDGLTLTVMPTFSFMCGDIVKIDNSLINLAISESSELTKNYNYYLDEDGYYTIYQISYNLENRNSSFSYTLNCKSKSLLTNIIGGK